jgi:hypothetical protein
MAMTPDQTSLIKEIGAGAALFLITFMQQWNARKAKKERKANAEEAKLSANRAAAEASKAAAIGEAVHTLVNSNMGAQLKLVMELSEFKASVSPTPENMEAAKLARTAYESHQTKQALVDAKT